MEKALFVLELVGVAAFAVSGAIESIEKNADIFGVLLLAVITALGGGIIRDILLGQLPPRMFVSYTYLLVAVLSGLAVFCVAYFIPGKYFDGRRELEAVNNVFDAIGLAVFTVSGMNMAMQMSHNVILVLSLGVVTGIGGGMLRDVMIGKVSVVLRKRVYAVAALLGGIVYYVLSALNVDELWSVAFGILCIFTVRILATLLEWNLPRVKRPN